MEEKGEGVTEGKTDADVGLPERETATNATVRGTHERAGGGS